MNKIKIGVLCPSEIAFRRFMPALMKNDRFEFVGISSANEHEWSGDHTPALVMAERKKAQNFIDTYGGRLFSCYNELLCSEDIDAVYIPLPPALHYMYAKAALENGKHVLLEKPFTDSLAHTSELLTLARERRLAVHENYMFVYHTQLKWIKERLSEGAIGDLRLIRIDFGFPFRGADDFRYNKELGGGALLDCGGYTIRLASEFLGDSARITASQLNHKEGFDVDIYGSATLTDASGLTAQVSFGMDNSYKCSLELWGSTGTIFTNRILTAPDGFEPTVLIKHANDEKSFRLEADDTFGKSIGHFYDCISDDSARLSHYRDIEKQSELVEIMLRNEAEQSE